MKQEKFRNSEGSSNYHHSTVSVLYSVLLYALAEESTQRLGAVIFRAAGERTKHGRKEPMKETPQELRRDMREVFQVQEQCSVYVAVHA